MPILYRYVKNESWRCVVAAVGEGKMVVGEERRSEKYSFGVIIAAVLIMLGGGLLSFSIAPIVAYEIVVSPKMVVPMLSPIGDGGIVLGMTGESADLMRARNWFSGVPENDRRVNGVDKYSLWIPKLGVEGAVVAVGGEDLSKSLVHYAGTALPGQPGNAVIFGHSVLPQFFNPRNYMTIFSTLPTLKKGDEVVVNYDGVTYKYQVEQMFEVKPADIQILEQRYSDSYLTLITCVPPGTYLRRLVIKAKLIRPDVNEEGGFR